MLAPISVVHLLQGDAGYFLEFCSWLNSSKGFIEMEKRPQIWIARLTSSESNGDFHEVWSIPLSLLVPSVDVWPSRKKTRCFSGRRRVTAGWPGARFASVTEKRRSWVSTPGDRLCFSPLSLPGWRLPARLALPRGPESQQGQVSPLQRRGAGSQRGPGPGTSLSPSEASFPGWLYGRGEGAEGQVQPAAVAVSGGAWSLVRPARSADFANRVCWDFVSSTRFQAFGGDSSGLFLRWLRLQPQTYQGDEWWRVALRHVACAQTGV